MDPYTNYIELNSSVFRSNFAYFDLPDYLADSIFINHKIKINFGKEMHSDNEKYIIVFCSVRKRERALFLQCLDKLKNNMLICGNTDYPAFCQKQIRILKGGITDD